MQNPQIWRANSTKSSTLAIRNCPSGVSLAVQWLRLHTSNARDAGSNTGGGTKIPHAVWPKKKKKSSLLLFCWRTCIASYCPIPSLVSSLFKPILLYRPLTV